MKIRAFLLPEKPILFKKTRCCCPCENFAQFCPQVVDNFFNIYFFAPSILHLPVDNFFCYDRYVKIIRRK